MTGDRVWQNGRIWTGTRYVEQLVTEGGRVVAALRGGSAGRESPTGAERMDLRGRLVLPGFIDPHLHLSETARRRSGVELRDSSDLQEIGDRIARHRVGRPPGAIWGGGWDQERLTEGRMPDRADLDRWAPDRPLLLHRVCLHIAVVNTVALAEMGIDRNVPDPPGGSIDRDRSGDPTGILRESALTLLDRFPFPPSSSRPEMMEAVYEEATRAGVVALASMRASRDEIEWAERHAGAAHPRPAPRFRAYGRADSIADIERWADHRRCHPSALSGVKLFADGSFGARSAWLEAAYADTPGGNGTPAFPSAEWEEAVRRADAGGMRVSAHAIGDRALRQVLEVLTVCRPKHRPRIEHASLVGSASWPMLEALRADVVVQPGFRTSDRWLPKRLGEERISSAYPTARLRRTGAVVAASSDAPVEPLDPISGIRSAIAEDGVGEAVSVGEALAMYTTEAARVLDAPDLGTLEPGASASLVVLDLREIKDLATADRRAVLECWIDGQCAVGSSG